MVCFIPHQGYMLSFKKYINVHDGLHMMATISLPGPIFSFFWKLMET